MLKFSGWSRPIRGRDWWRREGATSPRNKKKRPGKACRRTLSPEPERQERGGPERSGGDIKYLHRAVHVSACATLSRQRFGRASPPLRPVEREREITRRRGAFPRASDPSRPGAAGGRLRRSRRSREGIPSIGMNDRPSDGRGSGREGPGRHVRSKCR